MEELRGTFENSATDNPLVSDSQKKPSKVTKRKKALFVVSHIDKYIILSLLYVFQNEQNEL